MKSSKTQMSGGIENVQSFLFGDVWWDYNFQFQHQLGYYARIRMLSTQLAMNNYFFIWTDDKNNKPEYFWLPKNKYLLKWLSMVNTSLFATITTNDFVNYTIIATRNLSMLIYCIQSIMLLKETSLLFRNSKTSSQMHKNDE